MTTIINTPPAGDSTDSGMGLVFGVIIALGLIALFFVFVLPAIRANNAIPQNGSIDVNVKIPDMPQPTPAPAP